ncbi:hypothetical protein O0I10_005288 [Lichtheimia ornata]|uniref:Uncharacterized protein n=1 Tax=Lichtheimia ornata TaxID=688661 RepID=A0AAD7V5K0_9FUNG|nr:uncharacterized protein O0I10_005288 [Lichtheimia ornata]KAJ8658906.1 hypothetical protein O0I10_005288 [Lichtheimia ornata]
MEEDKLTTDHDNNILEHADNKDNEQKDKDTKQDKQDVPITESPLQDDPIADSFVDLDINKDESTNAWRESSEGALDVTPVAATTANSNDNRPLESGNDSSLDPWQEDTSLLNGRDSPDEPIPVTVAPVVHVEHHDEQENLDKDISHTKGFYNANDLKEIVDLEVSGQLPDWLVCEHFTVGPGTYDIKYMRKLEVDGELQHVSRYFTFGHWFDGLPLVNRFDIHGQRNSISYRNRLTCRRLIDKIRDNHGYSSRHPGGLFMTKTNQTVLTKVVGVGATSKPDYEPCSARVLPSIPGMDGRLFCQNRGKHIQELDPFDMRPTRVVTWNEVNPAFKGYTSCPNGQFDARTGEYINFTMDVGYQSTKYNFFTISDRNPKGALIGSVTAPAAYVNSFSITPKYIILAIFPMLATSGGMKFSWNESILESFTFNRSQPTLFYVLSRQSGQHVATYRSDACFAFHHVNAFEDENDNVYVDIICYPDDTIAQQLMVEGLRNPTQMKPPRLAASELRRYVLHTVSVTGSRHPSTAGGNGGGGLFGAFRKTTPATNSIPEASYNKWLQPSLELPQVNPNYKLHAHTFMYGLGFSASSSIADGQIWDTIIKANMRDRTIAGAWHEKGCYPSEAVFIPRPSTGPGDEVAEDDGVLLSIVMDSARSTSFLLVLDAASLDVLAKAYLGTLVPLSFSRGSYRLYTNQ